MTLSKFVSEFTSIPVEVAQDRRLDFGALGLLTYLTQYAPKGSSVSTILSKFPETSLDEVTEYLGSLIRLGYVREVGSDE